MIVIVAASAVDEKDHLFCWYDLMNVALMFQAGSSQGMSETRTKHTPQKQIIHSTR
jgi:hypothetical protein